VSVVQFRPWAPSFFKLKNKNFLARSGALDALPDHHIDIEMKSAMGEPKHSGLNRNSRTIAARPAPSW
jgi:hypothetical protein